ncbi:MAG: dihydrodipicolinate synthase family protein [Planctomycetes bacterium]|nr:dihydrodipicolinate synthase family protein [Planctomycetota bacterium]
MTSSDLRTRLLQGIVIPASPLALTAERRWDERRQRALVRYYAAAGVGGLAVGVHTTQFAIREPRYGLYEPVLRLAAEELSRAAAGRPLVRVAGVCGATRQAVAEASTARELGYDAALLSLSALAKASEDELVAHCRAVAEAIPVIGFYLQPTIGGCVLPYSFWRRFAEIENVVAIKIAAFDRYKTLDVIRAVTESGRDDIALYTGNDDNIVVDLLTPFRFMHNGQARERRIVGGLLGHWAVWTRRAVELLEQCHAAVAGDGPLAQKWLTRAAEVTDMNAAIFDAANAFVGCIPGVHEALRRQGLLAGVWCLDEHEQLSPGQADEIDRVCRAYPHLVDDNFVRENLDSWLA